MIKKLDWYIIKKFLTTFSTTLGLFIIIIVVFDVSEKLDDFLTNHAPLSAIIFDFYLNYIPNFLNLFSPIFIFISVIFFTSKLASRTEVVAMLASGISYRRFLRPYIITATLLAILSFMLNGWIIPKADKKRIEFENRYVRETDKKFANAVHRQIKPGTMLYIGYFTQNDSTGGDIALEKFNATELESKMYAKRISWNKKTKKWKLDDYFIRDYNKDGSEKIKRGTTIDSAIEFNPDDFFMRTDDVQSFNMTELNDFIEKEEMRGASNTDFYVTEKYRRYASPFSTFILVIIGVCVSSKKSRGGVGLNLGIGILLSFLYLFVIQYFISYGNQGKIFPMLAVWYPNLIFGFIAFILYRKVQK
ncbi:MAG: LptF/LptG family permease [Bacteroidia bacterium]|nr:LptF/LptG family permease [Bacteroidia bacterium]